MIDDEWFINLSMLYQHFIDALSTRFIPLSNSFNDPIQSNKWIEGAFIAVYRFMIAFFLQYLIKL